MRARISLCGDLEVELDGERVEGRLPGRQGRLVLALLVLNRARPVARDELIGALWPREPPSDPDEALSALLSKVRQVVGKERLTGRRGLTLELGPGAEVDVEQVRLAAERAQAAAAGSDWPAVWEAAGIVVEITDRGFLVGHEAPWVDERRGELAELGLRALEWLARAGVTLRGAHLDGAERAAARLMREAPLREAGYRLRMEALAGRGEVAEALAVYDQLRVVLRDELGTVPGDEARALHEQLLTGGGERSPAPAQPRAPHALPDRLAQALAAPWVGRGAALERLQAAAERASAGRTDVALVTGDGGIGKTRLVAELASRLDGFEVLYGRCDEEELFPFGPWVDMLRPHLARMAEPELRALAGSGAADLARLLPEIRALLPEAEAGAGVGDPEAQRRQLFVAIVALVRGLARQAPVLLVVDDLHWADRSSLLLARHLARETGLGPVLLVGTFRDSELDPGHPLPELLAALERDREVARVRLDGMDEAEVAELIGSWHGEEVRARTVRTIRAETDGNPFFVKQLVRHLEEVEEARDLQGAHVLAVPPSVRDVLASRVARLPDEGGRVLRVAALIGRDFDYELLEQVVDLPEDPLLDVLDAAVRAALLTEVPSAPGRYSFVHALLRTSLASELSATRRARLHLRIAEAIEQLHREQLEPWLEELARHFAAAGPNAVGRAVAYAVRAAEQATIRLAYEEAVRLLGTALDAQRRYGPDGGAELADLGNALARAQAAAGQWQSARATFARAAGDARAAGASSAFARAALGHAGGTWDQYATHDAASVDLLREALERLPAADSPLRAQVLARLAVKLYFVDAQGERVTATADEAVAMARRLGEADALVAALRAAQHARWRPGRAADRLAVADELVELTGSRGTPVEAAEAHLWRALAQLELCRLDEADADLARHAELAERTQRYALLVQRDALRAMRAVLEGDYAGGAQAAQAVLEWGQGEEAHGRSPTPIHAQSYGAAMVAILNEKGELGRLTPFLERLARESIAPAWLPAVAWAHVQSGRAQDGRAVLETMAADGFGRLPRDTNFLSRLAQVAHVVGELGDARLAAAVEPLLAPFAGSWVVLGPGAVTLGPVAYSLAVLQLVLERPEEAARSFERALELARMMRARPYVARSQAGLAAALRAGAAPGDAGRAGGLLHEALTAARALGMTRLERELSLVAPA